MSVTEIPTAQGHCPTDEELAAFLDGMLSESERARVVAHLADCESCYEIFAGVVHFQQDSASLEQEGTVVPFPSKKDGEGARSGRWWIPAAAAAVLAVGVGFAGYQAFVAPPEIAVKNLMALITTPHIEAARRKSLSSQTGRRLWWVSCSWMRASASSRRAARHRIS
jgi:predicted anti-sigma-YlaC factor YlaD